MSNLRLSGIIPPVVTPFTPDGQIDRASLVRLVNHFVDADVDGLFALGSTGEVAYLSDAQRREVVEVVCEANAGRLPVVVGCIDLTWARVVDQAKTLASDGVAAVVATAPLYARNSMAEINDHFRAIAAGSPVPLIAYDVPVRVGVKLLPEQLVQLGAEGAIIAVKDSSGDDVSFRRLVVQNRAAGSPLQVLTGHEVVCDGMVLAGADGIVPGLANVDAAGYVRLWQAATAGDWAAAAGEQERLNVLMEVAFQALGRSGDACGVGGFKTAMAHLGLIDSATMAKPVEALDGEVADRVRAIVDGLGLGVPVAR